MRRDIDIGQKIVGMEQLLRRTLGEHIECEFRLDQNLWQASVDPGQLASALLNLVLNARDAMPSGGTLTVEVQIPRSVNPMWTSMARRGPAITSWSP